MEFRIVSLDCYQMFLNTDLRFKLFPYLAGKRFLRSLVLFYLSAGEFPSVLEITVSALGREDLISVPDNGGNNIYGLHYLQKTVR